MVNHPWKMEIEMIDGHEVEKMVKGWLGKFLEDIPAEHRDHPSNAAALEGKLVLDVEKSYPERIAGVAVLRNGEIWALGPPARHHHILWAASALDKEVIEKPSYKDQGFVTTHGRYADRKDGWTIAAREGQLLPGDHPVPGTLFSEDLW